ncbi:diguanylate cyclase [Rubrivivax gelatinosus]|uniref:diguanylate cyclase n=1 Tax=Rubrivivax gelatinosus TaxID=28068 RepID=UPI003D311C9F
MRLRPETIVWIVPDDMGDADASPAALRALGYTVIEAPLATAPRLAADLRVLPTSPLADEAALRAACAGDRRPTLVLAHDAGCEAIALEVSDLRDEVVRLPQSPEHLAARIDRLVRRDRDSAWLHRDMLTGLLNRRAFGQRLRKVLEEMLPGEVRGLVLLDLDHFKRINEQFGHSVGDQLLRSAAETLAAGSSPDDPIGRLGGDEFVLLLTRYDTQTLLNDARALLRRLSTPLQVPSIGDSVVLTASAGLTLLRPHLTEGEVMRQADAAMYEAKGSGRNRLMCFEASASCPSAPDIDADLERFNEVTKVFSDRLARIVGDMGRRLVEGARRQALQDALTGAHNRRYFDERLAREVTQAQRNGRPLALALMDIDDFHGVNAGFGWPSGDAVLREFATLATGNVRLVDWLARYGGEEFCVVLPDTGIDAALAVMERIRAAVAGYQFHAIDGRTIPVTVSVGVAALGPEDNTPITLVDRAGRACLRAKAAGKDRVVAAGSA